MIKEEGYNKLKEIVNKELFHEDYKRVTELADKYYKMKTGDGIEELLQRITTRTTDEEWEQVKKIYKSIIPSTLGSTKLPFQKAVRKQPDVRKLEFPANSETKKSELEEYISEYWGDKSLDEYLEYAFIDYNYIDPNAFLITEFDPFDPRTEKASPYPFVADSTECIMFEYKNEILQYLVVRLPIKYKDGDMERDGFKYTMYLGMDTIVFNQVANKNVEEEGSVETLEFEKSRFFTVYYYEPKNEKVPAIRFGFKRDEQTKGRTFVSLFNDVVGFLEKTLKIDSELDLSTAMVAFPQRFAYVSACQNQGCNKGKMLDDTECPICHGTGVQPFHKSTADIVTFALPRNADPAQLLDLNNLLVYKTPPIELLTFQKEYLEYLKTTAYELMFNVDRFTRSQVSITATEAIQGQDNLNDTLYPFARQYSAIYEFVVKDIATFTDLEDVTVQHKFPYDFKMKGLIELMQDLKMAKDANTSPATIAAIEDDINEILYYDRPDELKRMKVKNAVNPFRGYSNENIRFIISQGNTTMYNRTLWENQEAIFQELEAENQNPWFYDLSNDLIYKKVKEKTDEYIERIKGEKDKEYDDFISKQPVQGQTE